MMQQLIIAAIVLGAATFIVRRVWAAIAAARASRDGCGSGCGCAPATQPGRDQA